MNGKGDDANRGRGTAGSEPAQDPYAAAWARTPSLKAPKEQLLAWSRVGMARDESKDAVEREEDAKAGRARSATGGTIAAPSPSGLMRGSLPTIPGVSKVARPPRQRRLFTVAQKFRTGAEQVIEIPITGPPVDRFVRPGAGAAFPTPATPGERYALDETTITASRLSDGTVRLACGFNYWGSTRFGRTSIPLASELGGLPIGWAWSDDGTNWTFMGGDILAPPAPPGFYPPPPAPGGGGAPRFPRLPPGIDLDLPSSILGVDYPAVLLMPDVWGFLGDPVMVSNPAIPGQVVYIFMAASLRRQEFFEAGSVTALIIGAVDMLVAAVSRDGGRTFTALRTVYRGDPIREIVDRPTAVFAEDGSLWVAWSSNTSFKFLAFSLDEAGTLNRLFSVFTEEMSAGRFPAIYVSRRPAGVYRIFVAFLGETARVPLRPLVVDRRYGLNLRVYEFASGGEVSALYLVSPIDDLGFSGWLPDRSWGPVRDSPTVSIAGNGDIFWVAYRKRETDPDPMPGPVGRNVKQTIRVRSCPIDASRSEVDARLGERGPRETIGTVADNVYCFFPVLAAAPHGAVALAWYEMDPSGNVAVRAAGNATPLDDAGWNEPAQDLCPYFTPTGTVYDPDAMPGPILVHRAWLGDYIGLTWVPPAAGSPPGDPGDFACAWTDQSRYGVQSAQVGVRRFQVLP